jgi:galactokinase/mevalonate kinase-like predicted kinase
MQKLKVSSIGKSPKLASEFESSIVMCFGSGASESEKIILPQSKSLTSKEIVELCVGGVEDEYICKANL